MALQVGSPVGDFTFLRPDGSAAALSGFGARPLVLIFVRHLG